MTVSKNEENIWFFSRILPGSAQKLSLDGGEGVASPNQCFFSDLDSFWAPGASCGAPKWPPTICLHDFSKIREQFCRSVCKENNKNPTKTFKQDERETNCKSNGWQLIPRWSRLARTCSFVQSESIRDHCSKMLGSRMGSKSLLERASKLPSVMRQHFVICLT